ncbi:MULTISPECIES: class I SAM-dependent methyltransferase [unclassified Arthrobacter]|uniref:class I SAM-dependent methyltransferase n=1 Tax=unclassified Arthrobacter TaxID=235627 RepID=UPI002DF8138B|nr:MULTISPECIES: methyltransferase domain-containing protein [unclassified Arthrobacter]MEC5191431.1 ubiquinone/menaquinone biosynthesis C-methylase UbiE [Arthrobacter sp. MP_M4]MEC5203014.1 ubiquinone/menaquinone biosynthesis C-methylase UbiE [Arthrobacter sp. MP_M7]
MTASAERIRDQQRSTWDEFSAGWRKWDAEVLGWHAPFGDAVLQEARLRPDSTVLDVASGTGEPGLTAATLAPRGSVVLLDLSEGMLRVAAEKAASRGLPNVATRVGDAAALPFEDATFDAVLCRFGLMFFPSVSGAVDEMVRVARPGSRISAAVWGRAAENPWATLILGTIARHTELPVPATGAPGLFRCAAAGFMARVFQEAGLVEVSEQKVSTDLVQGSPDLYWEFMTEIATTVGAGLAGADRDSRDLIRADVFHMLGRYEHRGAIRLRSTATIVAGTRAWP